MSGRMSFDLALDEPETQFENNTILKITRLENEKNSVSFRSKGTLAHWRGSKCSHLLILL